IPLPRNGHVIHVCRSYCSVISAYPVFEARGNSASQIHAGRDADRRGARDRPLANAKSGPPCLTTRPPWRLAASARLCPESLMAAAAVVADALEVRFQPFEAFGIALRRLDVVGKLGDRRFKVVHSLPDHRGRGGLVAGF